MTVAEMILRDMRMCTADMAQERIRTLCTSDDEETRAFGEMLGFALSVLHRMQEDNPAAFAAASIAVIEGIEHKLASDEVGH